MAVAPADAAEDGRFHVLAVDDSLMDRKLIERLLKTSSYQVTTVDSGNKALEFLGLQGDTGTPSMSSTYNKGIEVSLVITDYSMPGMTGYDLLKRIKESSSVKDIPVVIMSAEDVPSRISRCMEGGAEAFLLKPVKIADMVKLRPHIQKGKLEGCHQSHQREQVPQQEQQSNVALSMSKSICGSKRKATDEGVLSPRKRPGYKDQVICGLEA